MTELLPVSVVMSVHANPSHVAATLDSVLEQSGVGFEVIVIDDGATEPVKQVLARYQNDDRVEVLGQANQGLTKALIRGCEAAQHPLVARIDAGDLMIPGRLRIQAQILSEQTELGLLTSWVEVCSEEGYVLYEVRLTRSQLEAGATAQAADCIVTPVHSSVMFRKSVYLQVGGYREQFYFAQDCDLWSRMVEHSGIDVVEQVLTRSIFSSSGISAHFRKQQMALKALIAEASALRASKQSDDEVLARAVEVKSGVPSVQSRQVNFAGDYFIARCLSKRGSTHAREYWKRALALKPWSLKSWFYYLIWRLSVSS